MKTALSIAGFDPSSGAGVSADLAVFAAHRIFGISAITALTVQSTRRVGAVSPTDPGLLEATLAELVSDLPPDGIKIGMLASRACVQVVVEFLENTRKTAALPVVLDPVLMSSSGTALLEPAGVDWLIERLLPLCTWATPNRQECAALAGLPHSANPDDATTQRTAETLRRRWPEIGWIVTGGDATRADDLVLAPAQAPQWLRRENISSRSTHGTGCAFSSALLCGLVQGLEGLAAAAAAKAYVAEAIRQGVPMGQGRGPLNLLWPLTDTPSR